METIKKLIMVILCMILALSCKSPLEEGVGGGDSGGGDGSGSGTQVIDGKTFPGWYLTKEQQEKDFSMGPTILFASTTTPKQHYRIPAIIVATNGNIIAIGDNRKTHGGDIGAVQGLIDIVYRVSEDGGNTWTQEKIMGDASTSYNYSEAKNKGDVIVFRANDGTLVCLAVSGGGYSAGGNDATPSRIVRAESIDNGKTWSNWEEVGQDLIQLIKTKHGKPQACLSSGRGLTLKDGTFAATMAGPNWSIIYVYSKDKGRTWHYGQHIKASEQSGSTWKLLVTEPKVIAELEDGKLLMSVRNATSSKDYAKENPRKYAISTTSVIDGNATWPATLSSWNFRCGDVDAEGVVWTRQSDGHDMTRILHIQAGPRYRAGLRLYLSENQGNSFPEYYQITTDTTAHADGVGYSSLDVCGDGTIVTFVEERTKLGQYYDLVFRRYNMHTITKGQHSYKTSWYK